MTLSIAPKNVKIFWDLVTSIREKVFPYEYHGALKKSELFSTEQTSDRETGTRF
jgi:hypothetical protein